MFINMDYRSSEDVTTFLLIESTDDSEDTLDPLAVLRDSYPPADGDDAESCNFEYLDPEYQGDNGIEEDHSDKGVAVDCCQQRRENVETGNMALRNRQSEESDDESVSIDSVTEEMMIEGNKKKHFWKTCLKFGLP